MTTMTDRSASSPSAAARRPGRALLAVLLTGQFMSLLDVNIVNVALPTLRSDLGASGAGLQLVVAGYVIAYAVLLVTGARLGALAGPGRMFRIGVTAFTAASLACGLAPDTWTLVAFRFAQGAAAALMLPQVMSLIQREYTGAARARALGVFSAVVSGGIVAGQVAGGLLVGAGVLGGWRPVFLVNVPVGLALMLAAPRVLPRREERGDGGLDLPGLLLLTPAVLALVVPLILGHELGWPVWGWASLAASPVLVALLVVVERRVAARGGRPLVNLRVLRAPGVPSAAAGVLLGPCTWAAFLFTTTLHLQGDLGYGPLASGLAFVPCVTAFALVSTRWQRLPERWHRPLVPIGYGVAALGYLFVGPLAGGGPAHLLLTVVIGTGLGVMPIAMNATLAHVPAGDAADGSGLLLTLTQLGQVIGIATVGTLFLTSAAGPGSTRHAEYATGWALAAVALLTVVCTLPPALRRRGPRVTAPAGS
ncbi:MFS transporter [Actinomadura namibiensis]|uniref:MFS family permease n=1 Tax=Actinomadura namibiensis TaxID=182080 RepID=A0A7W3LQX4_ACTNM|nr:MFS transporter [Actinomadura namibiensis]MBA8952716.1 MFS family permease [Actinomadura namibiensis]